MGFDKIKLNVSTAALKSLAVFFLILITVGLNVSFAQKDRVQTMFIYNFTKYIKWPDNYVPNSFVIGILGDSPLADDLGNMASLKKQINGKPITVKNFRVPQEVHECQILILSEKYCQRIEEVKQQLGDQSVLIISDYDGMARKGAVINFVEVNGKIRFELNQQAAQSRNLKVSGSLINLAILV